MNKSQGNNHILNINTQTKVADVKHFSNNSFLNTKITPTNVNVEYIYTDENKTLETTINNKGQISGRYKDRKRNLDIVINKDGVEGATNLKINHKNYALEIEEGKVKSAYFVNKGKTHQMKMGINENKNLDFQFNRTTLNKSYQVKINKNMIRGDFQLQW